MSFDQLLDVIYSPGRGDWTERNKAALAALFGSGSGRYPQVAAGRVALRAPKMSPTRVVPFAAYIHPSNPTSGAYSGFSFVMFPSGDSACLIGLVLGTQGLAPDEAILGRPGHARKVQAICKWLNKEYGGGVRVAWAKQDPTRTDIDVPDEIKKVWAEHRPALERYGKEVYALFGPTTSRNATEAALAAFLDLLFEERGYKPLSQWTTEHDCIRSSCFAH